MFKKLIFWMIMGFLNFNIFSLEYSIALKDNVKTSNAEIYLKDIITEDTVLPEEILDYKVGASPDDENTLNINFAVVKRLFRKTGYDYSDVKFDHIRRFCTIERKLQIIDYEEIRNLAVKYIEDKMIEENVKKYEINEIKSFSEIKIPFGKYSIEFEERENSDYFGKQLFKYNIFVEDRLVHKGNITFDVDVFKEVLIAGDMIRKGTLIDENMLDFQEVNISKFRYTPCFDMQEIIGKIAQRTISIGTVITDYMLSEPYLVKKGEAVNITYSTGSLIVQSNGVAMEDGYKNEVIKVKNLSNKRLQSAVVVNSDRVEINY